MEISTSWTRGAPSREDRRRAAKGAWRGSTGLALVLAFLLACVADASAQTVDLEQKRQWQHRYRDLKMQEARLQVTFDLATKEYADSNRRNYRRSGVRHFHRTNANQAKVDLQRVREEMDQLRETARIAGLPRSWFDEVDDERIDLDQVEALGDYAADGRFGGRGAYEPEPEPDGGDGVGPDEFFDDGRNPLYERKQGPPAGLDPVDGDTKRYDYGEWREDREEYESERAKERHLVPGSR